MIAKSMNAFRRAVAGLLLRGPILNLWYRRKFLRVEKIFLRKTVESSVALPANPPAISKKTGMPLRKIAFIADIMWEANELIPELAKICDVEALNLRPALRGVMAENAPGVVLQTVKKFIAG